MHRARQPPLPRSLSCWLLLCARVGKLEPTDTRALPTAVQPLSVEAPGHRGSAWTTKQKVMLGGALLLAFVGLVGLGCGGRAAAAERGRQEQQRKRGTVPLLANSRRAQGCRPDPPPARPCPAGCARQHDARSACRAAGGACARCGASEYPRELHSRGCPCFQPAPLLLRFPATHIPGGAAQRRCPAQQDRWLGRRPPAAVDAPSLRRTVPAVRSGGAGHGPARALRAVQRTQGHAIRIAVAAAAASRAKPGAATAQA